MLTLTLRKAAAESRTAEFRFQQPLIRIGRVPGNDLVLEVNHISSKHACIRQQGSDYAISDLGSTNGSVVLRRGKRLLLGPKGAAAVTLQSGDCLLLGDIDTPVELDVQVEAAQPSTHTVVATRHRLQTAELLRQLDTDKRALPIFFRLTQALSQAETVEDMLQHVAQAALEAIPGAADALIAQDLSEHLLLRAAAHSGAPLSAQVDAKLCRHALDAQQALLYGEHSPDLPAATLAATGVGSGIVAPLSGPAGTVGVLQINCPPNQPAFGQAELDLAVVLSYHAASAWERSELLQRLREAEMRLREENRFLKTRAQSPSPIVAESNAMRRLLQELKQAATADITVLLCGETGTGKEVAARFVHQQSRRADKLLVPVNCGALSETLLDSELFGHRRGAFTGATSDRKGVFEMADGGSVFLDEVGEMPPSVQVRLLRVLESGMVKRVGDAVERKIDARIIAATNRDLSAMVAAGQFRQDLFYRLRGFPLILPPLRERKADIEPLCHALVERLAPRMGKRIAAVESGFVQALRAYPFPGNVRELVNEVERAIVRADDGCPLTAELLSEEVLAHQESQPDDGGPLSLREQLARFERRVIEDCLERHSGRRVPTAKALGLTRQGLAKKIDRLGIK